MKKYVIGLDYGTDSVRAVLIDTKNGAELASSVSYYKRWKEGRFCSPEKNRFRQHPSDHIEGLEKTITEVVRQSGVQPEEIVSICIDTTGSSPLPVNHDGIALSLTPGFEENPNAMMVLWKDHTSILEAEEINTLARTWGGEDYTRFEGGIYSSEWFWAKILHINRVDEEVKNAAHSWMEHCDYITFLLSDHQDLKTFKRSRCAAGHKAMWHESWGGLPSEDFLNRLDPSLGQLRGRLYDKTYTSDEVAGHLNEEWAQKLGLTTSTVIAVGTFDAHSGAIGVKVEENTLVRIMGTSTCDIMVAPTEIIGDKTVKGICGQVDGSVIPGMAGLEAGQSAFGDVLAWFRDILMWPVNNMLQHSEIISPEQKAQLKEEFENNLIKNLTLEAEKIPVGEAIPVALDWVNGRRTPDANQELKAAISHLSLGTKAPHIFKALVNAICFGAKKIVDRFEEEGVSIHKVIGIGGVARKSPFIMQTLANVLDMPIIVAASDQAPALGAAIYAAVAAGVYPDVQEASRQMGSDFEAEYHPQPEQVQEYARLMQQYQQLADFTESVIKSPVKVLNLNRA
ncbi:MULTISPECIES: ribulokinase [Chryseobacterium]|uniref:Ribulokinase n=1 Tax=Chryseobacterium camelliae TaxID=1265445 RepID=A0ABU0TG94_9FLAO|nr:MULTISPECIES: ribulokinase [Chryseobacterium]MDT3406114.1 L-ribulokinase [Pseudacidovorax intermedius]MDQ1096084.1 L-ribulokinase [Chryseobacterium camelliae]MDQ1100020.1 L-ribulokinase [Chryseobacterium sp. SORGH_AS_1048]MDR6087364.1 L-ribulokinase [Chryseobacterium sp. SORGH_AS_0909]MDR6131739.1 L-ribulokinase [Chryseobacterium sp. SORGH_AS_1175]